MKIPRKTGTSARKFGNIFDFQKRCFVAGFVVTFLLMGTFVYAFGGTNVMGSGYWPVDYFDDMYSANQEASDPSTQSVTSTDVVEDIAEEELHYPHLLVEDLGRASEASLTSTYQNIIRIPLDNHVIYRNDGTNLMEVRMDAPAFVSEEGTLMVPLRFSAYALGYDVSWNCDIFTATLSYDYSSIQVTPGSNVIKINGQDVPILDEKGSIFPAYLHLDYERIFIPINALSLVFNIEYSWDERAQEVILYLN